MFNQEEFEIVKKRALENHIPIIMDDTLEQKIAQKIQQQLKMEKFIAVAQKEMVSDY